MRYLLLLACLTACAAAKVTLLWDAATDPTVKFWLLSRGTNDDRGGAVVNSWFLVLPVNTNTVTLTNLLVGTNYHFTISARNASGMESEPSEEVVYPELDVVLPPTNLQVTP